MSFLSSLLSKIEYLIIVILLSLLTYLKIKDYISDKKIKTLENKKIQLETENNIVKENNKQNTKEIETINEINDVEKTIEEKKKIIEKKLIEEIEKTIEDEEFEIIL